METDMRLARTLAWVTIAWNLAESAVSIAFGVGDRSLSLLGFGVDSLIEVASGALIVWRLSEPSGGSCSAAGRERTAATGIGLLFMALGAATAAGAAAALARRTQPRTTLPGALIGLACVGVMLWLWSAKKKVGERLGSKAVLKDAECSLACAKLSGVLLAGSAVYILTPVWWADSAAAAVLALQFLREGWETVQAARKPDFAGGCGCSGD